VRVGTYNVLGLTGFPPAVAAAALGTGEAREEHFAAVFGGLGCDVLVLQEGPAPDLVRRIAERLQMHVAGFASPTAYPGYVLSRAPIRESRTYAHAGPGGRDGPFSRAAGAARLDLGLQGIWVVGLHLHPSNRVLRDREAELLEGILGDLGAGPVVVAGDFNAPLGETVHAIFSARGFTNAMEGAGGGVRATMDTDGIRPHAIDHIYVSPELSPALEAARVVTDPGFRAEAPAPAGTWVHSDHLPVLADLRWP
jgi:endonuclease/exonuclease/phosphatase family metal-dependent hydrolase